MANEINLPAYPCVDRYGSIFDGLTKRELIAAMICQGLCSNDSPYNDIAERSVDIADKLLQRLESTKKNYEYPNRRPYNTCWADSVD